MRRLFILRPEPGASVTLERARDAGLDAVSAPLFEIVPVEWQAPDPSSFDGLLLTSANALRCAGEQLNRLRTMPVYCVGAATAAAARDAGFGIAAIGGSGVERLLASVEPDLKLLHLAGEERRATDEAPQAILAVPVYRAEPLPRPVALDDLSGQVAAAHSPRAAARLAELVAGDVRQSVRIAAISPAAAEAAGSGWEKVAAADDPTDDALLALAASLCEEDGRQ
jgi:uroporphyrinogen-III synthase